MTLQVKKPSVQVQALWLQVTSLLLPPATVKGLVKPEGATELVEVVVVEGGFKIALQAWLDEQTLQFGPREKKDRMLVFWI